MKNGFKNIKDGFIFIIGNLTIINCEFINKTANSSCGAIYGTSYGIDTDLQIESSRFINNSATGQLNISSTTCFEYSFPSIPNNFILNIINSELITVFL